MYSVVLFKSQKEIFRLFESDFILFYFIYLFYLFQVCDAIKAMPFYKYFTRLQGRRIFFLCIQFP